MATRAISDASILINNIPVPIIPNSFSYTEGLGEDDMRTESAGGGSVTTVYSKNVQTALSSFKFKMANTNENLTAARAWKTNANANGVIATDRASGFTRTFSNAALVNQYEPTLGADGDISLEWKSDAAV